jgi:hypothetical protein
MPNAEKEMQWGRIGLGSVPHNDTFVTVDAAGITVYALPREMQPSD